MHDLLPTLSPAAPQAASMRFLFYVTLVISAVILTVVVGMIVYATIRYRARSADAVGRQITGNTKIEIAWTVIPTLILAGLFVLTVRAMTSIDPTPPPDRTPDLVVVGHQWWWEVRYPASGAVTANEIHIPAGRRLLVRVESADVVHDFWVPQLTRKVDMVPGHPNHVWLEADHPGVYQGLCAEFCGAQHAHMRFTVVAQAPKDFEAWVRAQALPAVAAAAVATSPEKGAGSAAAAGQRIFRARTCSTCHEVRGTVRRTELAGRATPGGTEPAGPFSGEVAPDLTHLASRSTLAAGMLANTPDDLARWLTDPQAIKPGSHMPNLDLSHREVSDLVAYLETLR